MFAFGLTIIIIIMDSLKNNEFYSYLVIFGRGSALNHLNPKVRTQKD